MKSHKVEVGHALLYTVIDGAGPPILFLHAGVADHRMWLPQMDALSNRFQTIAYDRRGFGQTVTSDESFTHAADLEAMLDHLQLEAAALVGCSQGGRIAIDFALAHPERVAKLVLIAPAVSGAPAPDTLSQEIESVLEQLDAAEEADDVDLINEIEAHLWLDGPTSAAGRVSGPLRDLFLNMNGIALQAPELSQEIEPPDAYHRLAEITVPTRIYWGSLDFPHVQERCQYLLAHIPNSEGHMIDDVAHLPNLEQPDLVTGYIAVFFDA